MYHESSRFNVALILGALVLAAILLSGCPMGTPPPPSPTPVPIAAWVAHGIPDDTFISYSWNFVGSQSRGGNVTIMADGAVTAEFWRGIPEYVERRQGQISQNDLRQILIKFVEIDFFSLASDGMCVYYRTRPPSPSEHTWGTTYMDYSQMGVLITLHGVSGGVYISRRGGPPQKCLYDRAASDALGSLEDVILDVGRQVPQLTPTAAPPTPSTK